MTLVGCENVEKNNWELSSAFSLPVTFDDGTEGEFLLIGKEGKGGFLVGSGPKEEAVVTPIIATEANKYMWHFWGEEDTISGDFKVVATNEYGEKQPVLITENEKVWEYPDNPVSPNNGADSHIPSSMVFPTSGKWKL